MWNNTSRIPPPLPPAYGLIVKAFVQVYCTSHENFPDEQGLKSNQKQLVPL